MKTSKSDVFWNFIATFFKIASSVLLLPVILHVMPSEEVGIWTIFASVSSIVALMDFGFNPSFARNLTYIFSGVQELRKEGIQDISGIDAKINYGLLKGTINAMRWFYSRISFLFFFLLSIGGTFYISVLLKKYEGNTTNVYVAWAILVIINSYSLYTQYYESLLLGKGLIGKLKKVTIIAQIAYLGVAAVLIYSRYGLVAIVLAQFVSLLISRISFHLIFFDKSITDSLKKVIPVDKNSIIKSIYPNAVKVGMTFLGGFLVSRSALFFGSLVLSLNELASFGISIQLVQILSSVSGIYTQTYLPKISYFRVGKNLSAIKEIYITGFIIFFLIFLSGGAFLIIFGNVALEIINSRTFLINSFPLLIVLLISFLEMNHGLAGNILMTGNEVPFFKHSLLAGAVTMIQLLLLFNFRALNLWGLILAPGIAHLYNNWKWPYEVFKLLEISFNDFLTVILKPKTNLESYE